MTPSRFVILAIASATLLAALAGCLGPGASVAPELRRRTSDVAPYVEMGVLEGQVRRGQTVPPDDQFIDPSVPWPGIDVEVVDAAGALVGQATSDAKGMFQVSLPAGSYRVEPQWPVTQIYHAPGPPHYVGVTLTAGAIVTVRLVYDPGIL